MYSINSSLGRSRCELVMVNGRVLETGAPEDVRRSKAVLEAYLGDEVAL